MKSLMRLVAVAALVGCSASAGSQTVSLNRVMRDKLSHSQQLLDAVVTSNWAALELHSVALRKATAEPAWAVLEYPEYVRETTRFVRALDDLIDAAKRRDLEATPLAYVSMTLSCVQCHQYVARMRMADARTGTVRRLRDD